MSTETVDDEVKIEACVAKFLARARSVGAKRDRATAEANALWDALTPTEQSLATERWMLLVAANMANQHREKETAL